MTQKNLKDPGNKNSKITNNNDDKKPLNKNLENMDSEKEEDDDNGYTVLPSNDSGITNDDNAIYDDPHYIEDEEEE